MVEKEEKGKKVSRRDFLKRMGFLAAGGVAISKLDKLVTLILKAIGEDQVEPQATVCYTYRECNLFDCIAPSSPFQCNQTFICDTNFYCPNDGRFICVNNVGCKQKFTCAFTCSANFTCD